MKTDVSRASEYSDDADELVFDVTFFGTDDLFSEGKAERIIAEFTREPLFKATHYGTGDEDMTQVSSLNAAALASFWRGNNHFQLERKGKEVRYEATLENVIPAEGRLLPLFSLVGIRIYSPRQAGWSAHPDALRQFVLGLASAHNPIYGCCLLLTGSDILWNLRKHGIPDVFWINIMGHPYVEMIGKEKLIATPYANVEPLSWGGVLLETKDLTRDQCDAIKKHLGRRLFVRGGTFFQPIKIPYFPFPKSS